MCVVQKRRDRSVLFADDRVLYQEETHIRTSEYSEVIAMIKTQRIICKAIIHVYYTYMYKCMYIIKNKIKTVVYNISKAYKNEFKQTLSVEKLSLSGINVQKIPYC